ncbi:MAG TPA: hypothetical protein VGV87_18115 [Blastocatellia bacterium]|nr:hypothetical protein [Blastocatellia bacterium]
MVPLRLLTCLALLNLTSAARPVTAQRPSLESVAALVRSTLTSQAEVFDRGNPWYEQGDFNGDGLQDLAVLVLVESGREELRKHGVKYINIDPFSRSNGLQLDPLTDMGQHCLGLAILHGSSRSWSGAMLGVPVLVYDCFSGCRVIKKGTYVRRGRASRARSPVLKGDALQLELETGGQTLVYWDGRTYRGFARRTGD